MLNAIALLRKICRQICRQIFRRNSNPSLPLPACPRGQKLGAVPGTFQSPPEPQRTALNDLIDKILSRLAIDMDCRARGARVIAKLRDVVGDLPASDDHHHSEPYGLLRHSLEVALKMLEEFEAALAMERHADGVECRNAHNGSKWPYVCFLAGLSHDLGKVFDMEVRQGKRDWSPLHETYADFVRQGNTNPVLRWREDRVRGAHAVFTPGVMHHLLSPADFEYLGGDGLDQLHNAITRTHSRNDPNPLARLLSKLDQQSVEEAAPNWMIKRPDSKVNQFVRAVRTMIENGELGINSLGAPVYVTDGKAAVVVPLVIQLARDLLKQEKITLPGNIHLYDLLRQSQLVESNEAGHCVHRIKVPSRHGPVELSALIFATEIIVPKQMIPNVPILQFEIKGPVAKETKPTAVGDPLG